MAAPVATDEALTNMTCRFYEQEYPDVDECVVVEIKSIAEMGAYVTLLEYGNIEGMILLSELSRRRIRSINKLIRVGKLEVAMVVRVDEQKGYIDLSKRRVSAEDIVKCEDRFSKGKLVNSIMRHVAHVAGKSLLEVNQMIAWPLAKSQYKSAYEAMRTLLKEPPSVVFSGIPLDDYYQSLVVNEVKKRLTPQAIRVRADIEVSCFGYEGINAVKAGLKAGLATGSEDAPVVIKLIAPPSYVVLTTSMEKAAGIATLDKAIACIDEEMKQRGGKLVVKIAPRVTSAQEENALSALLEQMQKENTEVDGDEDDDQDPSGGLTSQAGAGVPAAAAKEETDKADSAGEDD